MVFYEPPKRQPRKASDGKITDLPDELLLDILDRLDPLDYLRFRATCRAFTPASNTAITRRMKKLYISPLRSSLLAAVEICAHPAFSSSIEEIVVLGSEPQRDTFSRRRTPGHTFLRVAGEAFKTWPTTFPTASKTSFSECQSSSSGSFCDVYKPLLDALSKLPRMRKLSFASAVSRAHPGFNQVKQDSLRSFPKRHVGKSSARDKRWSDAYAMFAILASLGPRIQDIVFSASLLDQYSDLEDAENDFAVSLINDNTVKEPRDLSSEARDRAWAWANAPIAPSVFYMPRLVFRVSEGSAIAGIRHYRSREHALEICYTQQDGQEGRANLWTSRINAE